LNKKKKKKQNSTQNYPLTASSKTHTTTSKIKDQNNSKTMVNKLSTLKKLEKIAEEFKKISGGAFDKEKILSGLMGDFFKEMKNYHDKEEKKKLEEKKEEL
jgi:hypothetical protein